MTRAIDLDRLAPLRRPPRPGERVTRLATRWRRPVTATAVTVATLSAAVAAAPLPPPAGTPATVRLAGPYDAFRLVGDHVLVAASGRLMAHALDGHRRWTTHLPGAMVSSARLAGDVVLIAVSVGASPGTATTALDLRTGEFRWQRPGVVATVLPDRVVLTTGPLTTVVTAADGRPSWEYSPPADSRVVPVAGGSGRYPGDVVGAVEIAATGAAAVVDFRDGGRRAVAPWRAGQGNPSVPIRMSFEGDGRHPVAGATSDAAFLVGDHLIGAQAVGRGLLLHAARPGSTRPLWTAERTGGPAHVAVCGDALCHQSAGGLTALDPATGAERWRGEPYGIVAVSPTLLFTDRRGLEDLAGRIAAVDAASGRIVFAAAGWRWLAVGDEWAVLGRPTNRRYLQLASLEIRTGRLFDLARVRGIDSVCWSNDTSITCGTDDRTALLTHRYRP